MSTDDLPRLLREAASSVRKKALLSGAERALIERILGEGADQLECLNVRNKETQTAERGDVAILRSIVELDVSEDGEVLFSIAEPIPSVSPHTLITATQLADALRAAAPSRRRLGRCVVSLDVPTTPLVALSEVEVRPMCGDREELESGLSGLVCTKDAGHGDEGEDHEARDTAGRTLRTWKATDVARPC